MSKKPVLVISGGSSGIGQATALYFAQRGYSVYELSRRQIEQSGIIHLHCDVQSEPQVQAAINEVVQREGQIDLLIANAGFGIGGALETSPEAAYQKQFDVNVFGTVRQIQAVLPQMRMQGYGRILCLSSVGGIVPIPYQSFYAASKSAIITLARSLDLEVKDLGIRVTVFCPGDIKTPFTAARETLLDSNSPYAKAELASIRRMEKDEENGLPVESVARALWRLAHQRNPKSQVVGGLVYKVLVLANRLLPLRLVDFVLGKMYSPPK